MIAVTHCIAGVTFRTESNAWLPRLQEDPYTWFRIGDDAMPDVRHRIQKIPMDFPTQSPSAGQGQERAQMLHGAYLESWDENSPLLHSSIVQDRMHTAQEQPAQTVTIRVGSDRIIVCDFAHRVLDFFYAEEREDRQDERSPEERWPVSGSSRPAEHSRIHQVKQDALTAPPLTAEERKRLIRIAEFSPRMIPKLPLLQSPTVRAWLQPGLDGLEETRVYIYGDGLIIWNPTRKRLDYFYPESGGRFSRDQEMRIVVKFFRPMFAVFLPRFSALMMHSSGVIRGDRAALFLAPDAGGKSTVLEQATEGLSLNDDQIILRKEGDTFIAHATPFGRLTSGPCQAPLGGLFVLEKALHFKLTSLKPAALVKSLWDEHLVYTSILPRHLKLRAFDLFYEMCHQVPVYRMRFPKDYVDWDAIDAAMGR